MPAGPERPERWLSPLGGDSGGTIGAEQQPAGPADTGRSRVSTDSPGVAAVASATVVDTEHRAGTIGTTVADQRGLTAVATEATITTSVGICLRFLHSSCSSNHRSGGRPGDVVSGEGPGVYGFGSNGSVARSRLTAAGHAVRRVMVGWAAASPPRRSSRAW
jgi:hypothetical protein